MNAVERDTHYLLESIYKSDIYQQYRKQAEIIRANPDLAAKVHHFRGENFRIQNSADRSNLLAVMDKLAQESVEIRRIPEINAYLDAELALCRLVQQVCKNIINGIDLDMPEL